MGKATRADSFRACFVRSIFVVVLFCDASCHPNHIRGFWRNAVNDCGFSWVSTCLHYFYIAPRGSKLFPLWVAPILEAILRRTFSMLVRVYVINNYVLGIPLKNMNQRYVLYLRYEYICRHRSRHRACACWFVTSLPIQVSHSARL